MTHEQRTICAERIREQRINKGMTQKKLGEEVVDLAYSDGVHISMSNQTIINYEKGRFPDKFFTYDETSNEYSGKLKYLAQVLEVYPEWLIGRIQYRDEKERAEIESSAWWNALQAIRSGRSVKDIICDNPITLSEVTTLLLSSLKYSARFLESADSNQFLCEVSRGHSSFFVPWDKIEQLFRNTSSYVESMLLQYADPSISSADGLTEWKYKIDMTLYQDGKKVSDD